MLGRVCGRFTRGVVPWDLFPTPKLNQLSTLKLQKQHSSPLILPFPFFFQPTEFHLPPHKYSPHTPSPTHTHTCTHSYTHSHTYPHMHSLTYTLTHTHTHTHHCHSIREQSANSSILGRLDFNVCRSRRPRVNGRIRCKKGSGSCQTRQTGFSNRVVGCLSGTRVSPTEDNNSTTGRGLQARQSSC